jgi:hypothetical protein
MRGDCCNAAMPAFGTTQKCRSVRPMSAIESNRDIHRRCAEGPLLTHMHRIKLCRVGVGHCAPTQSHGGLESAGCLHNYSACRNLIKSSRG